MLNLHVSQGNPNDTHIEAYPVMCVFNDFVHVVLTVKNKSVCVISQVTLAEHTPPGSSVITVTATDQDSGENGKVTYRVVSTRDLFYIDPSNGECLLFVCLLKPQNCICRCGLDVVWVRC